jgi:uncharacterized membrane-anchored protein YitT (DUF2179 family)
MQRGTVIMNAETINGSEKNIVYCVAQLAHLPELKYNILTIDNNAIISVIDASEVDGKGYSTSIL